MKHLIFGLSATLLLALTGWGQITPGEQAHASVAGHRREAKENARRYHQKKGHRRHRRHHAA